MSLIRRRRQGKQLRAGDGFVGNVRCSLNQSFNENTMKPMIQYRFIALIFIAIRQMSERLSRGY